MSLPFVKTLRIKEAKIKILNIDKSSSNQTATNLFTDDSLSSFASNSTSNNFFKKSKSLFLQPGNNTTNTPSNGKRINHFQFENGNKNSLHSSVMNKTLTNENFTIENDFSSDNSVEDISVSSKKKSERVGSFRLNNSNAASVYFIKKKNNSQKQMSSSFNAAYDDQDDDNDAARNKTQLEEKRKPRKNSLMRKSQFFLFLLNVAIK